MILLKKILSFLYADFHWKLLSISLAFVLWFVGAHINNPPQNHLFNLRLQHHNMDILAGEGLMIANPEALDVIVRVGIRAPRRELDALIAAGVDVQAARIVPSIDFRAINIEEVLGSDGPVTVRLDVSANVDAGLEHFSIHPRFVQVQVDVIEQRTFPINVYQTGEIAPVFELLPIRLMNTNVIITGPRSWVSQIAEVVVEVDLLGIHADTELVNLPLTVVCHAGRNITNRVQLNVRETTAIISVLSTEAKELSLRATGSLASGLAIAEVAATPATIEVAGTPGRLQEIEYILIEFDLDGEDSEFVRYVNVAEWLPYGVFLRSGESPYVAVEVTVEPIERRVLHIPRGNVRSRGLGTIYSILGGARHIRVEVSGPQAQVNALRYGQIGLELDLRNRPIGIHTIPLNVTLPQGITLVQNAPHLRVQIHEPAVVGADENNNDYPPPEELPPVQPYPPDQPIEPLPQPPYENGYYNGNGNGDESGNGGYDENYEYLPQENYEPEE